MTVELFGAFHFKPKQVVILKAVFPASKPYNNSILPPTLFHLEICQKKRFSEPEIHVERQQ